MAYEGHNVTSIEGLGYARPPCWDYNMSPLAFAFALRGHFQNHQNSNIRTRKEQKMETQEELKDGRWRCAETWYFWDTQWRDIYVIKTKQHTLCEMTNWSKGLIYICCLTLCWSQIKIQTAFTANKNTDSFAGRSECRQDFCTLWGKHHFWNGDMIGRVIHKVLVWDGFKTTDVSLDAWWDHFHQYGSRYEV